MEHQTNFPPSTIISYVVCTEDEMCFNIAFLSDGNKLPRMMSFQLLEAFQFCQTKADYTPKHLRKYFMGFFLNEITHCPSGLS